MKWQAAGGGGKVLQVINATYGTETGSSSSTFADTNTTATITPSAATSKILVLVSQTGIIKVDTNTNGTFKLLRGATDLIKFEDAAGDTNSTAKNGIGGTSVCYLDSPNTTSATTYKTQFRSGGNTGFIYINNNATFSTITLLEIGA